MSTGWSGTGPCSPMRYDHMKCASGFRRLCFLALLMCSLCAVAGCASLGGSTAKIKTVADLELQSDVLKQIGLYERKVGGSPCPILRSARFLGSDGVTVVEYWIVDSNGTRVPYLVAMTPCVTGGVDYMVEPLKL